MASCELLVLRSGAVGLPGPYLQENLAPYRLLDNMAGTCPSIVMAIGGQAKNREFGLAESRSFAVKFRLMSQSILLADCDIHLQPLCTAPRIRGGPQPGHYRYHILESATDDTMQIALSVYCHALAHFSDIILFFLEDFGGMPQVVNFFSAWVMKARHSTYCSRSFVLLVPPKGMLWDKNQFDFLLGAELLSVLQGSEEKYPQTLAEVRNIITRYLDLNIAAGTDDIPALVKAQLARGSRQRFMMGTKYSATHTKALLQEAISYSAKNPVSTFDPVVAARIGNPVPEQIGEHILELMTALRSVDSDYTELVASALTMNAFPPGMHEFPADHVFKSLYLDPLRECVNLMNDFGLLDRIRSAFVTIATTLRSLGLSSASQHVARVQGHGVTATLYMENTCSLCFVRNPTFTLDCSHRICTACVEMHSSTNDGLHRKPSSCPSCQVRHQQDLVLAPPTAGLRSIELKGVEPQSLWKFLKDLQKQIGLTSMPLKEYFDAVIARDTGIFFAFTLFIESWTLADCKHHLSKMRRCRIRGNRITFGKNLSWDLTEVKSCNNAMVTVHSDKTTHKNFNHSTAFKRPDIALSYGGGPYNRQLFMSICSKLVSSLFYIELESLPTFYFSPEACTVVIYCRVTPGHALLDLLFKLYRTRVYLHYGGDEVGLAKALLCTEKQLIECRNMRPFRRLLTISALSLRTSISVQIDGIDGKRHNISKCPYRLEDLARDQGLSSVFGNSCHRFPSVSQRKGQLEGKADLFVEVNRLIETLQTFENNT